MLSQINAEILQMVLTDEGFSVDLAQHGLAALDFLEEAKTNGNMPSMIILDLTMPVVDGWQVAKRIDADPALRDIPLIVTSATEEQGESAKALHADAYLVKPFSTDEILGVVELFSLLS